jgi:3-oxoacyl-[acyl-carrier protein] reductase
VSGSTGLAGLTGRTALVTGAAHGIGAAIAARLAAEGATVHAVDLEADGGPDGVEPLDVTDPAAVATFVERVGGVDILVNNAGGVRGQTGRPLEDVTDDDWAAVVDANLTSTFVCTRAVVAGMKARGWGRVVNISSGAGRSVSLTGIQAYATAKAGQIGLTRQTAHELGRFGITVNCVAPGFVLSNPSTQRQWESYGPEGQAALVAGIAVRRLGTGEDIANAVRFFTAVESSWVTGQTIAVDGGHGIF